MPNVRKKPRQQGKAYTKAQREKIIQSIKPYLQLEYDLKNACLLAGVPYTTVRNWVNKDNALSIQIEAWQNMVKAKARQNVVKEINGGDTQESKWWLERREKKEFSTRTENTGADGAPLLTLGSVAEQRLKRLKEADKPKKSKK